VDTTEVCADALLLNRTTEGVAAEQLADVGIGTVVSALEANLVQPSWDAVLADCDRTKILNRQGSRLSLRDGMLCKMSEHVGGRRSTHELMRSFKYRRKFIQDVHGGTITSGHKQRKLTTTIVQNRAHWQDWIADVQRVVRQCHARAQTHRESTPCTTGPCVIDDRQRGSRCQ